jgi:hypothetical protein
MCFNSYFRFMKNALLLILIFCWSLNVISQVPSITGFSPKSAAPGDLDTIFGVNFHPLATNNLVQFGTAKANVIAANSNMLVVTVPFGGKHDYISVARITDSLIAYSPTKFLPSFNSSNFGFFKPSISSNVRTQRQVAIGDLNLDGKPDLVTIDSAGNTFRVYQNRNLPGQLIPDSFKLAVVFPNSSTAPFNQIKLADLNGDGKPEILVNSHSGTPANFRIFRNTAPTGGSITLGDFLSTTVYSNSNFAIESFDVNDLNADGKADIALITQEGLVVLRNNWVTQSLVFNSFIASATFINSTTFGNERSVCIADLDNDGKKDIVFTNFNNSTIGILKNNGLPFSTMPTSDFSALININTSPSRPISIELADLDLDGKLDIVSSSNISSSGIDRVLIYKNISIPGTLNAASFASKLEVTGCTVYHRVKVEDVNGDRKPDIILTNGRLLGSVQILENKLENGVLNACTFQRSLEVNTNDRASLAGMDICDLNMDGIPDIVSVKMADSLMYFFEGANRFKPTITSVAPNIGFPGDTIRILGLNFISNPAQTKVFFELEQAHIVSINNSEVKVIVPINATVGFIKLTEGGKTVFSPLKFTPKIKSEGGAFYRQKIDINVTGKYPIKVLSADLDNDQRPEILVLNRDSNSISVFRNISTGGNISSSSFAPPFLLRTANTPDEMVIADLDMDGKMDLLINYTNNNSYSIIRNNYVSGTLSPSSFVTRLDLSANLFQTQNMIAKDIDLDGRTDIINLAPSQIYAVLNLGSPGFVNSTSFNNKGVSTLPASSWLFRNFDVGDLDGDGKAEIVVSYTSCGKISIIKNALSSINDVTSFFLKDISSNGISQTFDIPFACAESVRIADMNGDGKNDIVVFNVNDDSITVFKNNSTNGCFNASSFQRFDKSLLAFNSGTRYLCDINGDGKTDIISEDFSISGNEFISAIVNTSTENQFDFKIQNIINAPQNVIASCVADLNNDSIPDFITANYNWPGINSISIFQGEPISKIPVIISFSPTKAAPDMIDTIYGKFFSDNPTDNIVSFGAVQATVLNALNNWIAVRVPANASYDRISVSVRGNTVYSGKKFHPIYSDTGATFSPAAFSVSPQTNTVSSGTINSIAFDDVDRDGKPDLLATNSTDILHVFKNSINAFTPVNAVILSASITFNGTSQLELMDMNGDGKRDIVALSNSTSSIRVLRNTATSSIINGSSYSQSTLSYPNTATKSLGDADGDGKPDLTLRNSSNSLITYRNTNLNVGGNVTFDPKALSTRTLGSPIYLNGGLIQADIDGDNLSEYLVGRIGTSNTVSIFRYNNLPGIFNSFTNGAATLQSDTTPDIILYGDLDNDSRNDVLTIHRSSRTFSIVKNLFNGVTFNNSSFSSKISISASASLTPSAADLGDIDGDGKPDLAIGFTNGSVSFYRNISQNGILNASSFASGVTVSTSLTAVNSLKIQDLNGDGIPEITVAGAAISANAKVQVISFNSVINPPTLQASALVFSNTSANAMKLTWTNGNGARRLVIASLSPIAGNPSNNKFYQANAQFLLGDTVAAAGNFVVYNGTENNVVVNGLNPFTTYYFKIVEFNGNGISSKYLSGANLFGSNTTLPVTLLNFTVAACNEKCADIKWQTSSEINNNYFEVERSNNTMDWKVIGRLKGAGNSQSLLSYGMIDYMADLSAPLPEKLYYRLKQVDFDGQFSLSKILALNLNLQSPKVLVFPNPFENKLIVEYNNNEPLNITIFDFQGTVIYSSNQLSKESLELSHLPAGMYLIQFKNDIGEVIHLEKVLKI